MMNIPLNYGRLVYNIDVPDENLQAILLPDEVLKVPDEEGAIREVLLNPIGTKKLSELAINRRNAVIIVSDITRHVPSYKLLPPLIDELVAGGLDTGDITIVFALGSHRSQTYDEKRRLLGDEIFEKIRCIEHDVNDCIQIGRTPSGTVVEIFRPVVEADLVVCTGAIEVHYFAGYTGGLKSILPGVSSMQTIEDNHRMLFQEDARGGNIDGPIRRDIEKAGEMLGVDFILNVVLNSKKDIVKVVAGDPIEAHRAGIEVVDRMYKIPVRPSDIVIASAGGYPKDLNLYQAHKSLENASNAVRDGGTLILLAECMECFANSEFERWLTEADIPRDLLDRLRCEFRIGGHKAACIARFLERGEVVLVSSMDEVDVKQAFMRPSVSVEEALDYALTKHGKDASIIVIPYSGSTLPVAGGGED